jgi:cytoskeletal protein RodZ
MRFSLAVAIVVAGMSVGLVAQQSDTFKVKRSTPEKAPKSNASVAKTAGPGTASAASSKDLENLEHQTAKSTAPPRSGGNKTPKPTLVKDKPTPPINFGGTSGKGSNTAGMTSQSPNPLNGRLKQKSTHQ